jgi:hypothetical protein
MKKTIFCRLLGLGSVPKRLLPVLQQEGIVILDECMCGSLVMTNVDGPYKRYRHRSEFFLGCLAITEQRLVCYTLWKRQMNISVEDLKLKNLYVDLLSQDKLSISFESSCFREGWQGIIEFRFQTDKAPQFRDALLAIGAQQGAAANG